MRAKTSPHQSSDVEKSLLASRAPFIISSISAPLTAIGSKPTAVSTEKRPPTSSGMMNDSKHMFETVLNVEKPRHELTIEEADNDLDGLNYLSAPFRTCLFFLLVRIVQESEDQ